MHPQCKDLCGKLAEDLAAEGLRGKTLTLKLKTTGFELRTRDKTLTSHISAEEDLFREALKLLRPELPITIRLMVRLCQAQLPELEGTLGGACFPPSVGPVRFLAWSLRRLSMWALHGAFLAGGTQGVALLHACGIPQLH